MMMIEISEHKLDKATDYAEKMLKYGGMLMQCLSEWGEESGYGERGDEEYSRSMMGNRRVYGGRNGGMNYREDEWEEDEMSERRGGRRRRDSMGRYR
jgi:hypothetical protein